ncbi:hypothetical protein BC939DRAFT_479993 [Gamsiella multidivaricata]|uniref:uncharacterized protein n=1 Tax=Gamsiella multidivaricata TaxID=101098 RepID=UPI00221FF8F3|nr:uncharacterized protein BC939DRAFT_479993 [Gamsiella multidivaricata]KAI7818937.1 hypothetical protein BC939DRAFT_479993 [Gamsiella multidivaricata]
MDMDTALYNYMVGLEPKTSKEVRLRQPTTLDAAIQQAIIVHSILHPTNPNTATTISVPTAPSSAEPMDLDAMNVLLTNLTTLAKTTTVASIRQRPQHTARSSLRPSLPKLDAATREYHIRHGLCHRCRISGRISKNCRGDRAFNDIETGSQTAGESRKGQGEL